MEDRHSFGFGGFYFSAITEVNAEEGMTKVSVETSLAIISCAVLLLACAVFYILWRLRGVLLNLNETLLIINAYLPHILKDANAITARANGIFTSAGTRLEAISRRAKEFTGTGPCKNVIDAVLLAIAGISSANTLLKAFRAFVSKYGSHR